MSDCSECKGTGRDGNADCLFCHSTGDGDFSPYEQCLKCFRLASPYPPYKCEYECDDDK